MFSFQGTSSKQTSLIPFPSSTFVLAENFISLRCFSSQIKTHFVGLLICLGGHLSLKRLNEVSHHCEISFNRLILHFALCILHFAFFKEMVGQSGLEPPTSRLSVVCSSQLSYWPVLVESTGIEPVTSCLQGRRSPS